MPALFIGGVVLLCVFLGIMMLVIEGIRDDRKRELKRAKEAINNIYTLAWQHRDLYPEMSAMVLDTIQHYEVKELG